MKLVFDRPSKPAVKLTNKLEFNLFDCQSKNSVAPGSNPYMQLNWFWVGS